jgi:hypothetical protein
LRWPATGFVAVALFLGLFGADSAALATHDGGADNFLIDMAPTGNAATTVRTVETCAEIDPNGVQDADEDSVDALDVDVVVGPSGFPAANPMIAFAFKLVYPTALSLSALDSGYLLGSSPGSELFVFSDPVPDTDGEALVGALDLSDYTVIPPEFGPGVLARATIAAGAAPPGIYDVGLADASHADVSGLGWLPHNGAVRVMPGGQVAVSMPCPPAVDVTPVSARVSVPRRVPVGAAFDVTVKASFRHTGSEPVGATVVAQLKTPPECSVLTSGKEAAVSLAPDSTTRAALVFEAYCFAVGTSRFSATAAIGIAGGAASEVDATNNAVVVAPRSVEIKPVRVTKVVPSRDTGKIYMADGSIPRIERFRPDGSRVQTAFGRPGSSPSGVLVDVASRSIFFLDLGGLRRINMDGSGEQFLGNIPRGLLPADLDARHGKIYGYSGHGIARINTDGTGYEEIVNGPNGLSSGHDLAIDERNGKIYYLHFGEVRRANLDGSSPELVFDDTDPTSISGGLAVDSRRGKIYWWQTVDGSPGQAGPFIRRANLDGSGVENLVALQDFVWDIEIDPAGQVLYWTGATGGTFSYDLRSGAAPVQINPNGQAVDFVPRSRGRD